MLHTLFLATVAIFLALAFLCIVMICAVIAIELHSRQFDRFLGPLRRRATNLVWATVAVGLLGVGVGLCAAFANLLPLL